MRTQRKMVRRLGQTEKRLDLLQEKTKKYGNMLKSARKLKMVLGSEMGCLRAVRDANPTNSVSETHYISQLGAIKTIKAVISELSNRFNDYDTEAEELSRKKRRYLRQFKKTYKVRLLRS